MIFKRIHPLTGSRAWFTNFDCVSERTWYTNVFFRWLYIPGWRPTQGCFLIQKFSLDSTIFQWIKKFRALDSLILIVSHLFVFNVKYFYSIIEMARIKMHQCVPARLSTYIHTYIHKYIHAEIKTYSTYRQQSCASMWIPYAMLHFIYQLIRLTIVF